MAEKLYTMQSVACMLSYDLQHYELAKSMVRMSSQPPRLKESSIWFGARRSEMATRAFWLDHAQFTEAARMAGCAIVW